MDNREKTEEKVFAYMEAHGMASPGERIVAGVSGGADSLCLLHLLLAYAEQTPVSLAVVHVNHGIREEAAEDARYVEALCGRYGLPFFLTEADVHALANEEGCSEEDAGRRVRYRAFAQAAERLGATKIAVAHNSNDNAETMLFHLFRGSGLKGLCGILPVRRDGDSGTDIIRPILCLERREVEAYLEARGIVWRRDSTNEGDAYSRNRIRHHILPCAEAEIAPGAIGHMCRTAELLEETEAYLEQQTGEALKHCAEVFRGGRESTGEMVFRRGAGRDEMHGYSIRKERFCEFHPVLQKRMLLAMLKELSPTGKDIAAVHVRDVLTLFERDENRAISLPFGIRALRQYGHVTLERGEYTEEPCPEAREVSLGEEIFRCPAVYCIENLGKLEFTGIFLKKEKEVPQNRYTKWFDYDKIKEWPVIRFRRRGDFLTIAGREGKAVHKSLKDYMITEKIPGQLRDRIPLLAEGSHVLWLIGWRISEYYKVDGNTKRVLQVRFLREKDRQEKTCCGGSETEEENGRTH